MPISAFAVASAIRDGLRVCELHVGGDLVEVADDLLRHRTLEHRDERAHRLDRQPRLLEVAVLGAEAAVAERRDGVERLHQEIRNLDPLQLLLELADQLLVAALGLFLRQPAASVGPAPPSRAPARRRSPPSPRPPRGAPSAAPPRSPPAPPETTPSPAPPRPASSTRPAPRARPVSAGRARSRGRSARRQARGGSRARSSPRSGGAGATAAAHPRRSRGRSGTSASRSGQRASAPPRDRAAHRRSASRRSGTRGAAERSTRSACARRSTPSGTGSGRTARTRPSPKTRPGRRTAETSA